MGLHEALFDRLKNHSGFATLVGGTGNGTRLYPDRAPDKPTSPYVVFELDDDSSPGHAMGTDVAPKWADGRFWCFSEASGDQARAIAVQLIAALRRYSGTHGSVTIDDVYLRGDRPVVEDEAKLLARLVEFRITYRG